MANNATLHAAARQIDKVFRKATSDGRQILVADEDGEPARYAFAQDGPHGFAGEAREADGSYSETPRLFAFTPNDRDPMILANGIELAIKNYERWLDGE